MDSATLVLYPSPGIGHLVSMVELGKLIQTYHPSLSVIILIIPATFETGATDKYITTVSTVVHDTLVSISEKSPIKAVILDFFSNAAFQVANSLELPTYYFYASGASAQCAFLYLATIHKTTSKNIKDLDIYYDIPGVPPVHSSDMPTVCFVGLEERAVDTLRDGKCIPDGPSPPVYLIGPLIASGNNVDPNENECLKCFWVREKWEKFLWVVREPPSDDVNELLHSGGKDFSLDVVLPEGFLARTTDKGLVVKNWAPQTAILGHDSVGGCVSHCGWNSSLEAVVAGVPMVAWPLYAEQKLNRVFLVEEIKVAVRLKMSIDGFVTAEAVEQTLTN
nr:UDP-glycosyltransferase 88B1-like [Tanacetum cinerariifolium]